MNALELLPTIYAKLMVFILVFTRISALFASFMLFRRDYVNHRILVSLSGVLSVYLLLYYNTTEVSYELFSIQMLMQLFIQSFIGFSSGIVLNIIFEIFFALGQIMSMQIGLGMASLFDPTLGSVTTLTRFYMFCTFIIFLNLNGHLLVIKMLIDSFAVIPINHSLALGNFVTPVLDYSGVMFSGSVLLALTVIVAMLLANLSLAVMTKFAPQFNIFSVGVNLTLVLGLLCIYFSFEMFVTHGSSFIEEGLNFYKTALGKLS